MDTVGLLGREALVTYLAEQLTGNRGAALVIRGERGIGRTACLAAAASIARTRGQIVLETAGTQSETHLPFAGLQLLLRPLLRSTGALPEFQRRSLLAALGLHDGTSKDSLTVRIAVLNLLGEAARDGGLLVIVDDAHWLDDETRQVLTFVARRLAGHHLVLIAASSALREELVLGEAATDIVLDRLSEADALHLVARLAGHLRGDQRRWVVEQAAGNPLAVRELALIAPSVDVTHREPIGAVLPLPETLERAFAGRVEDLPDSGSDVLLVAALALDPALPVVLAAAGLLHGHPVDTDVVELAEMLGLCILDDRQVRFRHPLVKAAIVQRESVSRRQAAHRALGAAIAASSNSRAWHRALGTAGPDEAVAAELEATAQDSIRRGDPLSAVRAFERAAQLSPASGERGRRLIEAARHAADVGQVDTVLRLLDAAASTDLSAADQVRAELVREEFDVVVMPESERVMHLCALAARAAAAGEAALHLDLLEAAARRRCMATVSPQALGRLLSLAADLALDQDARTVAVLALADPVGYGIAVLSALEVAGQATLTDGNQLTGYAVAARAVGDYAAAAGFFDRAEVVLRRHGMLGPLARNLCVAADILFDLGEWDRGAAALTEFETLSTAAMSVSHRASAVATRAKMAALLGTTAVALELVSQIEHSATARMGNRFLARAQIARGIACLSAGRPHDAYLALSRVFDPADPSHHFREQLDAVAYLAEAAAHTDRHDEARRLVDRMRELAVEGRSPFLVAQLAYADAVLAHGDGAEHLFLAALGSGLAGSAWHRARTQLAFGRWLRRRHRVTESRSWLRASLGVFEEIGATSWAAEATDELGAAGVPGAATAEVPVTDLLSAQELNIATLAARGLTNREIGEQLYLSPRTVSSHLYRMFPKLGISTRAQIAVRLGDIQVVGDLSLR